MRARTNATKGASFKGTDRLRYIKQAVLGRYNLFVRNNSNSISQSYRKFSEISGKMRSMSRVGKSLRVYSDGGNNNNNVQVEVEDCMDTNKTSQKNSTFRSLDTSLRHIKEISEDNSLQKQQRTTYFNHVISNKESSKNDVFSMSNKNPIYSIKEGNDEGVDDVLPFILDLDDGDEKEVKSVSNKSLLLLKNDILIELITPMMISSSSSSSKNNEIPILVYVEKPEEEKEVVDVEPFISEI